MALRYTPVVDGHLLLVTRLCEQFFSTKNTFLTVSVITKLAKIKKQEYLICAHCVRHVKYAMQCMSRDRLLQSITVDSLLAPKIPPTSGGIQGKILHLYTSWMKGSSGGQALTPYLAVGVMYGHLMVGLNCICSKCLRKT